MVYHGMSVIGRLRGENWLIVIVCPLISIMREQTMMLKTVLKQFLLVKMKTNPLKKCSETKRSHFWYTSLPEALFNQDK